MAKQKGKKNIKIYIFCLKHYVKNGNFQKKKYFSKKDVHFKKK